MKKQTLRNLILLLLPFFLFSCIVQQEIYFKKDFSGTYKYKFDFTEYNNSLKEDDNDTSGLSNEDFAEYLNFVRTGLKQIDGLSNIKIINNAENSEVYFSYEFANIKALNEALKYSNLMEVEKNNYSSYFTLKGKNLTYTRPAIPVEEDEEKTNPEEDDYIMKGMFVWKFNIEFEAEVKKHNLSKDTTITIEKGGKRFIEKNNIVDYTKKETKWVFKMK